MSLILSIVVYLIMGVVLGLGVLLAVKGTFWLLAIGGAAYLLLFLKHGCASH